MRPLRSVGTVALPDLFISSGKDKVFIGGLTEVDPQSYGGQIVANLDDGSGANKTARAYFPVSGQVVYAEDAVAALAKEIQADGFSATVKKLGGSTERSAEDLFEISIGPAKALSKE